MLDRKLLTEYFGASLLLLELSCFRNIVLPYSLRILLRNYTRKYLLSEIISLEMGVRAVIMGCGQSKTFI